MRILVADDDRVSVRTLGLVLGGWGHEVVACADGLSALEVLRTPDGPRLALLDWMMPGLDGVEVCRRARVDPLCREAYLILLTSRDRKEDVVAGLSAGADDYVTKPFHREELRARVEVGVRLLDARAELAQRVRELEHALSHVTQLQGLLPICSYCKRIRDDQSYWHQVEAYFALHAEVKFTHSVCPSCLETVLEEELRKIGA